MDSTSGRRNTNPPQFSRTFTSPPNWDQLSHDGPSDSGQFPIQMSYPSQPMEGDSFIARRLGTSPLDPAYNPRPSGIPEQRMLPKWQGTPTNPPQMPVGVSSTIPYTHALESFVFNDEDPWSPPTFDGRLQPKSHPLGQPPVNQNPYGNRFQTEGDPVSGVMHDKPQSDSGYGSLQSAYASSISNFDTGLQGTGNQIAFPRSHVFQQTEARFSLGPKVASSEVSPPLHRCPTCNKVVKTPSALRKHDQRHRKPFKCPQPGCSGSGHGQGFGTANDLDRHIRSKHADDQMFSCHIRECQEKGRKFARSDNYGVHLHKCHGMNKDDIKGIIHRKKEQYRLGAPSHIPQERNPDIPMQDASQDISFDHTMEQSNESLITDGSHYEMYDNDDQGPGLDDVSFYMPPDQSRDLEDKATHMLAEIKYRQTSTMGIEYFSGMEPAEPADTFEPVDFIMDPTLDISETATPVATAIGTTPKREDGSNILDSTDSHAQKALASALASKRSQDNRKSKGKGVNKKPKAPRKDPVSRRVDKSTLFSRNKPAREDSSPGNSVATNSKDEDCHTDSQDDDNAATILRSIKSLGYIIQKKETAPLPETPSLNPPASSQPTQPQSLISCPQCSKTFRRPSEMAKHKKRHSRPYQCTFPPCTKTFGSKNDWRRHENSQHLHYESWHCHLSCGTTSTSTTLQTDTLQTKSENPDHDKESCKHISYHLDAFKSHLSRTHQIPTPDLHASAASARTLAASPASFYCGFCGVSIGQGDWGARFDHLDAHFSGRGTRQVEMGTWKEEGHAAEGEGAGCEGQGGD